MELVIQCNQKRKKLILSSEWNVNFMQNSVTLNELVNLLLMCNLINTVVTPSGITQMLNQCLM